MGYGLGRRRRALVDRSLEHVAARTFEGPEPDAEEHDFKSFLLQYFWVNQKSELRKLSATSDDFLPTLARHIYKDSFS